MISRRQFLGNAFMSGLTLAGLRQKSTASDRPNILYIMADDHAANAIGCYGSRLAKVAPTKRLDQFAGEGMRLDNCFCTNSICVPSRAAILTGQYSHVNGVYTLRDALDPEQQNVAKLLRKAGYGTAMIGKWHLKTMPSGFDYWNVLRGQGRYHNPTLREIGEDYGPDFSKEPGKEHKGFCTDVITDIALNWLKGRDGNNPFFLMCHFKNCHGPWHYAERHEHLFDGIDIPEPESIFEDKSHRSPGSRDYGFTLKLQAERMSAKNYPTGALDLTGMTKKQRERAAYQKYLKDYLRCVAAIDENVGRLLDYLDETGKSENTVVIYTSDQGMFLGEHHYIDKRWIFEEALRMPFLVRYPDRIKPGGANDDIVLNTDFAPLFLDYADVSTPSDMQGRSFRSNLEANTPADWRASMYYRYWQHTSRPAHYGIRTKRYKLIFFYGLGLGKHGAITQPTKPGWELYDLEDDPKELKNVYNDPQYAKIVKKMKQELYRLKDELGDTDDKYPELMKRRSEMENEHA